MATHRGSNFPLGNMQLDQVERMVRLGLSVIVVCLMLWLILEDRVLSSHAQILVKALMAFAFVVLMAPMLRTIEIGGKILSWTIKATGASALFVIVWFTLPQIVGSLERVPTAELQINELSTFDVRSLAPPDDRQKQLAAGVAVTVPLNVSANSQFNLSHPAKIIGASLSFTAGDQKLSVPWLYFVTHLPGSGPTHLSTKPLEPAEALEIKPGTHQYREVLFATNPAQLNWAQLIKHLEKDGGVELRADWKILNEDGEGTIQQSCKVSGALERPQLRAISSQSRTPKHIVFLCEKVRQA